MSEQVGLKIGAKIELILIKGCPNCAHNQFFVVAGSEDPVKFYWLVCVKCGNKGIIPYWPFEGMEATQPPIVSQTQGETY